MARPRSLPPGIRPRGNGYVYDWRDATGRSFSRKAGETIADALAYKARIDAEIAAGTFVAGSKTTFAEYAAHWIETHPLKSQTRRGYRSVLRSDLLPYFGPTPLPKITHAMVREWFAAAHVPGRRDNTLRQHVAVLKSILKSARADGHIAILPTDALRVPRQIRHRPRVLTFAEAMKLIDCTPDDAPPLVAVAVFTGLRLGEILALTREDVDLAARVIHVQATLSEVTARTPRLLREPPKSDAGYRDVPIVEPLAEVLTDHLDALPPAQEYLFTTGTGALMNRSDVYQRVWYPTREAAGYPRLRFHDLRHTAASLLLAFSGAKLSELKEILGHSQIAHTVDLYGHLVPGRLDDIRDRYTAAIRDAVGDAGLRRRAS